ncbi:IclR family transcriptional regulator [Caenispirillum bisanense]|uniref:Transcriptional regulator, IclR family n=1 Tax=Caenispirillum bisanense TaxID=414052 RepID=A0A286GX25_9PROT|nr:helix-turn-helix domain-containing protein [Caenispirillum bisanense]SOD99629.1 transcriptional regulator, IclR family [Caenispirillum bisanense]
MTLLQTLDRGLVALEVIAQKAGGLSIAELAAALEVHRAIAYRLVATLEAHGLVARAPDGTLFLGGGVVALAARFEPHLRTVARPLLEDLARETQSTAYLSVPQGEDCVAIMVAEPEEALLRVGYRVGSRHPLNRGAAGIAILAGRPAQPDDPEAVVQARRDGYSITRGQLQRGAVGVASGVRTAGRDGFEACIGVVALDDLDVTVAVPAVMQRAERLAGLLGSR